MKLPFFVLKFNPMEEMTLIKKVKRDDELALNELIKNYEKMIYKIIFQFTLSQGDYRISVDELFQEGRIALYEACKNYSKTDNCKFSTFAYVVIKRKVYKAVKRNLRIYRREGTSIDIHDTLRNSIYYETKYVEDNPIEYQENGEKSKDVDALLSSLDRVDRKLIKLRLMNYSYKDIARMLKISRKKVDNRLQYLKRRNFNKKNK